MTYTSANFNGDPDQDDPNSPRMRVEAYQDGLTFTIKSENGSYEMKEHEVDILLGLLAERMRLNKTNAADRGHPMAMTLTSPGFPYGL